MTQWAAFVGITGVVLVIVLVLSYLTQQAFDESVDSSSNRLPDRGRSRQRSDGTREPDEPPLESGGLDRRPPVEEVPPDDPDEDASTTAEPRSAVSRPAGPATEPIYPGGPGDRDERQRPSPAIEPERPTSSDPRQLSTAALLANVTLSQGLFAVVLVGGALLTAIPPGALGIEFTRSYLVTGLVVGTVAGVGLYLANELGAGAARRLGIDHDEELRELLAPETTGGWVVLLVVVLPTIAFFEEFLFRAALIGAVAAGFDINIWLLAVGSSLAFAIGHGMQGTMGVVVTGVLGFVLAALFITTGSLLVVVVAHYLINAFEFIVHEGLGLEWTQSPSETITES